MLKHPPTLLAWQAEQFDREIEFEMHRLWANRRLLPPAELKSLTWVLD